ncbi:MAG: response regulator [Desulfobulbaceae bacterium]|nr:response regulator [Desulfobulbaceae bacterium]
MSNKKVLIVDDEKIIRKSLQQDLQDEGYEVETAASGEIAETMLDRGYDLIITDLVMEGMDGIDVLKSAKKINSNQSVFILTGYGVLNSAVSALRLGAEDYLLKPYNHDELMIRIAKCLEKQQMQTTISLYEDILSICSECKKIRDDEGRERGTGEWISIEQYISRATGNRLSHGLCPGCYHRQMEELKQLIAKADK